MCIRDRKKPSVKEKLDRYKAQAKQQKEAERKEPETDKAKHPSAPKQTVHQPVSYTHLDVYKRQAYAKCYAA